jgi:hypothetical protein
MLEKILKRIEASNNIVKTKKYSYGKPYTSYLFDDDLNIDSYNGILRVQFKGETLDHFHGKKGYNDNKDDGKDALWKAIEIKKKQKKSFILSQL